MAIYAINYDGLRKRDTYNELIDYIQFKQEKIIYPDRFAKRIRESPQISNLLDGEGLGKGDLEEHEKNRIKEILKEVAIIKASGTAQFSRADPANNTSNVNGNPNNHDEQFQDLKEHITKTIFENNKNGQNRKQDTADRNRENLNAVHQQNNASLFGAHNLIPPPSVVNPPQPSRPGSSTDPIPAQRFNLGNILDPPASFTEKQQIRKEQYKRTPIQFNQIIELPSHPNVADKRSKSPGKTQQFDISTPRAVDINPNKKIQHSQKKIRKKVKRIQR